MLRSHSFHDRTSWAHRHPQFLKQALPAPTLSKSPNSIIAAASSVAGDEGLKATTEESVPLALLLYPDEGKPGFAETAHLGNTMNWGDEQFNAEWPQAAAQLLQRVRWDLGDPPGVDIRALSLKEFCSEALQGSAICKRGLASAMGPTAFPKQTWNDQLPPNRNKILIGAKPCQNVFQTIPNTSFLDPPPKIGETFKSRILFLSNLA
jgi:hypothetical protein